jgi:tRNA-specific 2-thiouridylase
MDYRSFLRKELPTDTIQKGKFFDEQGNFIAWHEGYPFYTIGQRRGLGIDLNRAVFVKEIIPSENKVILGDLQSLEKTEMRLKDWNITNPALLIGQEDVIVKIRYRKQANRCTVTLLSDNTLHVQLHEPLTAIAAGQAAAFYRGDVVLGGGIIL